MIVMVVRGWGLGGVPSIVRWSILRKLVSCFEVGGCFGCLGRAKG